MSDRLHEVAQHIADHGLDADSWFTLREAAAESPIDTDSPRIIRTVEELAALDPDTLILEGVGYLASVKMSKINGDYESYLPAVVVATGEQVRAALEALKGERQ